MMHYDQINQLSEELAELQKDDAREVEKAAHLQEKINRVQQTIYRSSSPAVIQSKQREIEHVGRDLVSSAEKHTKLSREISERNISLSSCGKQQPDDYEELRVFWAGLEEEWVRSRTEYRKRVDEMIRRGAGAPVILDPGLRESEAHDFFLSYAREDKEDLVCELAEQLRAKGARVWHDEFMLKAGDSLRQKIEHGLANSLYGVVVLSPHFLIKEWPQKELESLISLEAGGHLRIFPIWHRITRKEIVRYSPVLLDRTGLSVFEHMIEDMAEELLVAKKLRPKRDSGASPL